MINIVGTLFSATSSHTEELRMKTWKTLQKKAAALLIAVLAVLTPLSSYAAVWQQGTGDYANRAQYINDLGQPAVSNLSVAIIEGNAQWRIRCLRRLHS